MPNARKHAVQGESMLLAEWLMRTYPNDHWIQNPRLGDDIQPKVGIQLDESELRMLQNYKRYADAIVVLERELLVVECRIWNSVEAIGQLLQYMLLVPRTKELQQYSDRKAVAVMLSGLEDPISELLCRQLSIRFIVYSPPWLSEYFDRYPGRRRRNPTSGIIDL